MSLSCAGCGKTNLDLARQCYACGAALEGLGPNSMIGMQILGSYKLVEVLGTGGMSVVYKALHKVTEQEVAIKILPPDLAVYDDVKARFVEEARTLARLEHPNIVALHNFAETDGRLHLVMQYVEGKTFEQVIAERGRVPWQEAVGVALGVLDALIYAHARGVVHRDIKPSNILVRKDGSVKVMDFGIAKITSSTRLTATGQTMGTVRYMSPEQVRGKELDGRSDLYSLGVTLYEGLAGATPFDGESHFEIMQKHLVQPVPKLAERGVEVPRGLEEVLLHAMAKNLDQRYPEAARFSEELKAVVEGAGVEKAKPTAARGPELRSTRGRKVAFLAGLLVLLASVGAWAIFRHGRGGAGEGVDAGAATTSAEPRWAEPHKSLRELEFAADHTYPEAKLRVLSVAPRNTDGLRELFMSVRDSYQGYLARESKGAASRRPLNLAVVPAVFLRDTNRFADATPKASIRYSALEATLFVADLPGFEREDLPVGIAWHLCPSTLSNKECQALADGFEKQFRAPNH
jgi:serine/threonine-protein kinase